MSPPERGPGRDAAIDALLATLPFPGWTATALRHAAGPDADLLFPGGAPDLVEAYIDLADRRMVAHAPALGLEPMRLPARVRALIATRLAAQAAQRAAVARAMAVLATDPALAARCTARTVDAIWFAAGDTSADFSWYTKRVILAAVYGSTLLAWLGDRPQAGEAAQDQASLAFLDRRLDDVRRLGTVRRTLGRLRCGR